LCGALSSLPSYGADADVRLARRIRRDTLERGRDVNGVIEQAWLSVPTILMYLDSSLVDPSTLYLKISSIEFLNLQRR